MFLNKKPYFLSLRTFLNQSLQYKMITKSTKGQLIWEQIYVVLNFPKMQQNIARISALASKIGQIKKVKAHSKL